MRSALLTARNKPLEIVDDLEVEDPADGEVCVRISFCGVCHSDLHYAVGALAIDFPVVLGHEASGIVHSVGRGVSRFKQGDRVILTAHSPCGRCYCCLRGDKGACSTVKELSRGLLPDGTTRFLRKGNPVYMGFGLGAFSEFITVPQSKLYLIESKLPQDLAALFGCALRTGFGAVFNSIEFHVGQTIVVIGLGAVGLSILQAASFAGAGTIIAVDQLENRLQTAKRLGAHYAICSNQVDVVEETRRICKHGADLVFEAVGDPNVVATAIETVRRGGSVICTGTPASGSKLTIADALMFVMGEKKIRGSFMGSAEPELDFQRIERAWTIGKINLEEYITRIRPLEEINMAFEDIQNGVGIRTLIQFS